MKTTPYPTQLKEVKKLEFTATTRIDCPFCGGKNTFGASKQGELLFWNCFHADCNAGGKAKTTITQETVAAKVNGTKPAFSDDLPTYMQRLTAGSQSPSFQNYLKKYSLDSTNIALFYDPHLHRAVYPIYNEAFKIVDGAGRSMTPFSPDRQNDNVLPFNTGSAPKWFRYTNSQLAMYCPKLPIVFGTKSKANPTEKAVIVEDACSAALAALYYDCWALVGTSLTERALEFICSMKYKEVAIILDKDANSKGREIARRLKGYIPKVYAYPLYTNKDLKDMPIGIRKHNVNTAFAKKFLV